MTAAAITLPPSLRFIERDWLSSNHLLGQGPEGNVLVDSGYSSRRELTVQLVEHALGDAPLDRIVNTHTHSDHVGGNAALAARYRCRITIPAREREAVERWDEEALHYRTMGQACDRFTADDWFDAGDRLRIGGMEWQALGSPGHDMDSLLLCSRTIDCWSRPMRSGRTASASSFRNSSTSRASPRRRPPWTCSTASTPPW